MNNIIVESIDYLFYNGGFDFISGYQKFCFRIRKDGNIEVTSITNHIKKIYNKKEDIYQFFAYLIFCDLYSSKQKSMITLCRDKDVSLHNLKTLNEVYVIYKCMLTLPGSSLAYALSDEDLGMIDTLMVSEAKTYDGEVTNLKYEQIIRRVDSYAYDFARRFIYYDNVFQELDTTEDYETLHIYAVKKWEDLENNKEKIDSKYFSLDETLEIMHQRSKKLEIDLDITFNEELKKKVFDILIILVNDNVDIFDLIYLIKCAFSNCSMEDREVLELDDFIEVIEVCYIADDIKDKILTKFRRISLSKKDNIISFNK